MLNVAENPCNAIGPAWGPTRYDFAVPLCGNAGPAALDVDDLGLNVARQPRQALPGVPAIAEQRPGLHDPPTLFDTLLAPVCTFCAPFNVGEAEFRRLAIKIGFLANPIPECRTEPVNRDMQVEESAERMRAAVSRPLLVRNIGSLLSGSSLPLTSFRRAMAERLSGTTCSRFRLVCAAGIFQTLPIWPFSSSTSAQAALRLSPLRHVVRMMNAKQNASTPHRAWCAATPKSRQPSRTAALDDYRPSAGQTHVRDCQPIPQD
jgi:hypothetical protein